jgi:hypothetical protein
MFVVDIVIHDMNQVNQPLSQKNHIKGHKIRLISFLRKGTDWVSWFPSSFHLPLYRVMQMHTCPHFPYFTFFAWNHIIHGIIWMFTDVVIIHDPKRENWITYWFLNIIYKGKNDVIFICFICNYLWTFLQVSFANIATIYFNLIWILQHA